MCETIKLNLFDLFTSKGKTKEEELEYSLESFDLAYTTYPVVKKSPIKLRLEAFETGKIRVNGSFEIVLSIPCDRCLEDVNEEISCDFDTVLLSEEIRSRSDDAEETSFLEGNEFDVYEFVNLHVLMNLPSKVLCREDCKGLCPVCGCNLNNSTCECDSFVPDPRMAKIKDIFYGSKEV